MSECSDDLITFEEAASAMKQLPGAFRVWKLRRGIPDVPHPTCKRKKLLRASDLPPEAQERLSRERAALAIAKAAAPPNPNKQPLVDLSALKPKAAAKLQKVPQSTFDFQPQVPMQQAIERAVAAVPSSRRKWVQNWCEVVGMCVNGTWQRYVGTFIGGRAVQGKTDFMGWLADQHNVSVREIGRKVALYRRIKADASVGSDGNRVFKAFVEKLLPKPKSGRRSVFDKPGNEWMGITLRNFYLNQAQFSVKRAWELLSDEIEAKQKSWKLGHLYDKPTLRSCRIALQHVSKPEEILGRLGDKAFNDKCSIYISRDPESLHSNDVWVTDQKQVDVRLRGAGEQLGRIWMVSFLDARSWKVMGYWFGPILSSDMVISAAALAVRRHGVPKAVFMDKGKEFQCTAFHGTFRKIKGEALFRDTEGLCRRLGIETIDAIGRNPQTKPIERWHREAARFDHNIPGWCGGNTSERPEVLAEFEHRHQEWKSTGRGGSPLWTIQQYLFEFVRWIENEWNVKHRGRGKYLRGMTPSECWNTQLPKSGPRRVSDAELALAAAEHRVLKVARGGQINITIHGQMFEYQAPELFLRQGDDVEVILSRTSLARITVLDRASDGRFLCEASAKPLFHWGMKAPEDREGLRQMIRIRNAAKRAISQGNAARGVLEVTATPIDAGGQRPHFRHVSSMEFRSPGFKRIAAPKTLTSEERASKFIASGGLDAEG